MAGTGFLTPGLLFINSGVDSEFKFLKLAFAKTRQTGSTRFVEPAAGSMAMCHMSRQAGWLPNQMEASDVVLFSAVMGNALMGQRVDHLEVQIDGFDHEDLGDPATVIWAEAVCRAEAKSQRIYWSEIARAMRLDKQHHLDTINQQLDRGRSSIGGLNYRPLDLFDHLDEVIDDPHTLVSLNPPSTKAGYEKFYDTRDRVHWKEPTYQVFDPVAGYERLKGYMERSKALLSIYEENQSGFEVEGAFVVRGSMRKGKGDTGVARSVNYYIVSNRPDEMKRYVGGALVVPWSGYPIERGDFRLLPENYPVSDSSRVDVVSIPADVGNYHRALWTHKFVGGQCALNLAMLLDGYLAGVFGYDPSYVTSAGAFGKDSSAVAIVYGMCVPRPDLRLNRLLSRLAMTRPLSVVLPDIALARCDHLVTAQLTQYPEAKEYRGIMKLVKRKKDPHHGFRPVWFLANWPWKNVGLASYAADFAGTWGRKARDSVVENQAQLGLRVRDDLNRASQWQLSAGGGMMAAGVGGPFTGYGFDLLILDDPIKNRQEADSITMRNHLWEWWRSTARTRLEPGGSLIIVATRWHEDDLIGRLLSDEFLEGEQESDRWEHIRLPALAEPGDPLGREEDAPLWPERYDASALAAARLDVGPQDWPGLYQQRPSRQGGSVFRDQWWVFKEKVEPGDRVFQFWDTAFKTGEQNDYSVCCTMTTTPNGYAVLDVWRNRVEYPDLLRAMQAQAKEHKPSAIFVEDAASGQSVVQSLRRETRLPVLPVKPVGDKVLRANKVTGTVEAKKITLPRIAPWLQAFREELAAFPNGVHDDQVDAFVGCLTQFMGRAGGIGGFYV